MTYYTISELLSKNTLEAMFAILDAAVKKPRALADELFEACDEFLEIHAPEIIEGKPFILIGSEYALASLTSFLIISSLHSKTPRNSFKSIKSMYGEFYESNLPMLTPNKAYRLFELVNSIKAKKVIEYSNSGMPFRTFFLPYRLGKLNSFYNPDLNFVCAGCVDIETGQNPEYVYLHELGHALHCKITDSIEVIPETFIPIFEATFNNSFDKVDKIDIPEIFADSFTVAVAYNTPYSEHVPFCNMFRDIDQQILAEYFKLICEAPELSLDKNRFWTDTRKDRINSIISRAKQS